MTAITSIRRKTADYKRLHFPRGYEFPGSAGPNRTGWRSVNPLISIALMISNLVLLLGAPLAVVAVGHHLGIGWGVLLLPVSSAIVARSFRGLENLVHEGSHFNVLRNFRKLNDLIVNCLAAYPVFQEVGQFRPDHLLHHRMTGADVDPCFIRWGSLDWGSIDRSSAKRFLHELWKRLPAYKVSWANLIRSRRDTLIRALLWHGAVMIPLLCLGSVLILGGTRWWIGFPLWVVGVALPFSAVLPVFRFVAESEKHSYDEATLFDATLTNVGWIHGTIFHPHGDGYHLLHHLDPNIPHHRLGRVHRWLLRTDPAYRKLQVRRGVLSPRKEQGNDHSS